MRNLEQSVGMHRRLEGMGKSEPGEDVGTFEFRWRRGHHSKARMAICSVRRGEGWECLTIVVKDLTPGGLLWERTPIHAEVQRLLPMFFLPDELTIQFHNGKGERARSGLTFWRRTSVTDRLPEPPEFGRRRFSLTKPKNNESITQEVC